MIFLSVRFLIPKISLEIESSSTVREIRKTESDMNLSFKDRIMNPSSYFLDDKKPSLLKLLEVYSFYKQEKGMFFF